MGQKKLCDLSETEKAAIVDDLQNTFDSYGVIAKRHNLRKASCVTAICKQHFGANGITERDERCFNAVKDAFAADFYAGMTLIELAVKYGISKQRARAYTRKLNCSASRRVLDRCQPCFTEDDFMPVIDDEPSPTQIHSAELLQNATTITMTINGVPIEVRSSMSAEELVFKLTKLSQSAGGAV